MSGRVWLSIDPLLIIILFVAACAPSATAEPAIEVTRTVEVEKVVTEEAVEVPSPTESVIEEPIVEPIEGEPKEGVALNVMTLEGNVTVDADDPTDEEYTIMTDETGSALLTHPEDESLLVEVYPETRLLVMDVESDYLLLFLEAGSIMSAVEPGGVRLVVSGKAGECEPVGTRWGNDVDELGYMTTTVIEGQVKFTPPDGAPVKLSMGSRWVASPDPYAPPASEFVYFDVSLDSDEGQEEPDSTSGLYSDMADELRNAGYTLVEGMNLTDVVDVENPSTYKTLVILDPEARLDPGNIDAVQTWVALGHSLFVVGEHSEVFDRSSINELLLSYGIAFTGEEIRDAVANSFHADHPVTQGVEQLQLNGCGALEVEGALPLGYTDSGHIMLAAVETEGGGRILVMADSAPLSNENWGIYDVERFTVQAFDWLAQR